MKPKNQFKLKVIIKDNAYIPGLGKGPIKEPVWITLEHLEELQTLGFQVMAVASLDAAYADIIHDLDSELRPKSAEEKLVEMAISMFKDFKMSDKPTPESVKSAIEVVLEEVEYTDIEVVKEHIGINRFTVTVIVGDERGSKSIQVTHSIDATPIEPGNTDGYDTKVIETQFKKIANLASDNEELTIDEVKSMVEEIVEDVAVDVVEVNVEDRLYEITLTRNEIAESKVIKIDLVKEGEDGEVEQPTDPVVPEDTTEEDIKILEEQLELVQDFKSRNENIDVDLVREYFEGLVEGVNVVVEESNTQINGRYFKVTLIRNNSQRSRVIRVYHVIDATPIEPGNTDEYDAKVVLGELEKVKGYETREEVTTESVEEKINKIVDTELVEVTIEEVGSLEFKVSLTRNKVTKFKTIKVTYVIDATPIEPGNTDLYDEKLVEAELTKVTDYETKEDPTVESVTAHLEEIINEEVGLFVVGREEGINLFRVTITRNNISKTKVIKVTHVIDMTPLEPSQDTDFKTIMDELEKVSGWKQEEEVVLEEVETKVKEMVDLDKVKIEVTVVEGQLNTFLVTASKGEDVEHKTIKITRIIPAEPIQPGDTSKYDRSLVEAALLDIINIVVEEPVEEDADILALVISKVEEMLEDHSKNVEFSVTETEDPKVYTVLVFRKEVKESKDIQVEYTFVEPTEPETPETEEEEIPKEPETEEVDVEAIKISLLEDGYEYHEEEDIFEKDGKFVEVDPVSGEVYELVFEEEQEEK